MAVSFMKIPFTNHWRNALTTYCVSYTGGARQGWFHNLWVQVRNKTVELLIQKAGKKCHSRYNTDNAFLPLSFLICPGVFYLLFDVVLPQAMGYSTSGATSLPTGSLSQPTMDRPLQGIFFFLKQFRRGSLFMDVQKTWWGPLDWPAKGQWVGIENRCPKSILGRKGSGTWSVCVCVFVYVGGWRDSAGVDPNPVKRKHGAWFPKWQQAKNPQVRRKQGGIRR